MAFLDNSGDIILDAVLTDTGRKRMAQGTFNVSQFALGDDEIDYSLYDKNAINSAYYDLKILQTPILESFTNNMSSLKSKLITIARTDLLYLPVLKLYTLRSRDTNAIPNPTLNMHLVAASSITEGNATLSSLDGIMKGATITNSTRYIQIDQGTDSESEPGAGSRLDTELVETSYIIEIDNKLGSIVSTVDNSLATPSYIDDDDIASYFVSRDSTQLYVSDIDLKDNNNPSADAGTTVLNGKRGTALKFKIKSKDDLAANDYLFNKLGSTFNDLGVDLKFIDSTVRVTGVVTGYRIDIPVRYIKV